VRTSPEEYKKKYEEIDKESEGIHDRQIDLDVPRCHQYNAALSSSAGHRKLKRILKAWVKYNPDYAYWQGNYRLLSKLSDDFNPGWLTCLH
jgi:TBC domain-containing protein kinase-like protein